MDTLKRFGTEQIQTVNNAVSLAEELVSNAYKMSASQWLSRLYDVKTLVDLQEDEIVDGPFAQIIRYEGQRKDTSLCSFSFDFYKICLQDHAILSALDQTSLIALFPFSLYIVAHELIHIVRFSKFLQNFSASAEQRTEEERHVHQTTRRMLEGVKVSGIKTVLDFYLKWQEPVDDFRGR